MFLPGAAGIGVEEDDAASDAVAGALDNDIAETTWCCYAWPSNYGNSGNRTFFVNQTGDITGKDDAAETGTGAVLAAQAGSAFRAGTGALTSITGLVAVGTAGRDGLTWKQVN